MVIKCNLEESSIQILRELTGKMYPGARITPGFMIARLVSETPRMELIAKIREIPPRGGTTDTVRNISWNVRKEAVDQLDDVVKELESSRTAAVKAVICLAAKRYLPDDDDDGDNSDTAERSAVIAASSPLPIPLDTTLKLVAVVVNNKRTFPIQLIEEIITDKEADVVILSKVSSSAIRVTDFYRLLLLMEYGYTEKYVKSGSFIIAYKKNLKIFNDFLSHDSEDFFPCYFRNTYTGNDIIVVGVKIAGNNTMTEIKEIVEYLQDLRQRFPKNPIIALGDFRAIERVIIDKFDLDCFKLVSAPSGEKSFWYSPKDGDQTKRYYGNDIDHALVTAGIQAKCEYDWSYHTEKWGYKPDAQHRFINEPLPSHAVLTITVNIPQESNDNIAAPHGGKDKAQAESPTLTDIKKETP